ncbi:23S rRNA pseudouridine(1911/1915/1917) synthase RluD [Marinicella meishanensis]|uniref:23S rRNA pseudouridine(1911/1915/1917) synthase RluD n=1 Tax=Marinicella meishanensis TaxID=2873263 RepID=UPI001CBAF7CE|nr:23S rRNA pseudouridine(1911/1915/1917) synthase RluD [Marinicella sp. NBU2979]
MDDTDHKVQRQFHVTAESTGLRLDQFLTQQFPDHSRAHIQQWIKQGGVKINGHNTKSKTLLKGFEVIDLEVVLEPAVNDQPEAMALDIVYEDPHLLIVNKPAGLVVHPGSGNPNGTLLNGLLALGEQQAMLTRAGIVHRLDKDTSGLMVVAKTSECQLKLIELLKTHDIKRQYFCVAKGRIKQGGTVHNQLGRHPSQRIKMAVVLNGKEAITHYAPHEQFDHYTSLQVNLETGRTHQIRVHMHHLGHPLVGDPLYGNPKRVDAEVDAELKTLIREFPRQALHAERLEFVHPITNKPIEAHAELPDDLCQLIDDLAFLDQKHSDFDEFEVEYVE